MWVGGGLRCFPVEVLGYPAISGAANVVIVGHVKWVIRIGLASDRVISGQHDSVRVRFRFGSVSGRVDFGSVYFWFNKLFLKRKMI